MAIMMDGARGGSGSANAVAAAAARARAAQGAAKVRSGSSSGGRSSGSFGGGRASSSYQGSAQRRQPLGTNSQGQYVRPAGPPAEGPGPVPTLESFLGTDTTYQNQLRGFAKALTDLTADVTRRKGILSSEYAQSDKALKDQRGLDLEALEEDYASRGVLRSGVYADAVSDYETEFNKRLADLLRRNQQAGGALDQEVNQFKSAQALQRQAAREAAARRRAETYGV